MTGTLEPDVASRGSPVSAERRSWRRILFEALLVAGAVVTGALSTGWPENQLQWGLLVAAAVFGALATLAARRQLDRTQPDGTQPDGTQPDRDGTTAGGPAASSSMTTPEQGTEPSERKPGWRRLVIIAVALVLAAVLGRLLVWGPATAWASAHLFGCTNPTEVRLLAAPEGLATARELADRFTAQEARARYGCAPVSVYVYARPPEAAHAALARGWLANDLGSLGPRPDLWLPGSGRYELGNPRATSNGLLLAAHPRPLATTPLVLALPGPAVPPEIANRRTALRWSDALALLDRLKWNVVRPDPASSATGALATVALYASDGGDPERLNDPAATASLLGPEEARVIENRVGRALDVSGYPLSDTVGLLCRHHQLPPTRTALILSEQDMVRHNVGRQCPGATTAPRAESRLVAVYPVDTLSLDYRLVSLEWPQRSAQQQRWTEQFGTWLAGADGRNALLGAGLRPPERPAGHPLTEALGALPGVSYSRVAPHRDVLNEVSRTQDVAQRPGRVLLALDASGSMRNPAAGSTRFALAVAAVSRSLALMSDRDEFGLWVFQDRSVRQLVRLGPGGADVSGVSRREATARALSGLRAEGRTPLYQAIVAGTRALSPPDPDRANALIVLTDGQDYGSRVTPAGMVAAVRGTGVRVFVVAIGEASCGTPAIREVTRISAGDCLQAGPTDLSREMERLFRLLWRGP